MDNTNGEVIEDSEIHTTQQQQQDTEQQSQTLAQNATPVIKNEESEESDDDDDDDDEDEDDQEGAGQGNQNGDAAGDAADGNNEEQNKEVSPEEKNRINYYRWMFFFFFFHFFTFIVSTDILNEFSVYLEEDTLYNEFEKNYSQILPTLNALLSFNIFVLIGFVAGFLLTFRYTLKIFYIFIAAYLALYLGKLVCCFMAITIEPEMNDEFSKWYEQISEDEDQKYCGPEDYNRCRITFAWNFFKYEIIFDVVVTTLTYVAYLYRIRSYKIQLLDQLEKEYQQVEEQSKVTQIKNPNNQLDMDDVSINNLRNDRSVISAGANSQGQRSNNSGSGVQN